MVSQGLAYPSREVLLLSQNEGGNSPSLSRSLFLCLCFTFSLSLSDPGQKGCFLHSHPALTGARESERARAPKDSAPPVCECCEGRAFFSHSFPLILSHSVVSLVRHEELICDTQEGKKTSTPRDDAHSHTHTEPCAPLHWSFFVRFLVRRSARPSVRSSAVRWPTERQRKANPAPSCRSKRENERTAEREARV